MAKKVEVGDSLVDQTFKLKQVTQIRTVELEGLYAPLSQSGTIIVNGFTTSCYAGILDHHFIHVIM